MSTPAQDKIIMLRALPTSNRLFWQHKFEEQIGQSVFDRTPDGSNKRELAGNEITTMALNEVAAARERGFFFHVLGRAGWKKGASKPKAGTPGEDEWSRALPQPGALFPAIVYIDYIWDARSRERFFASSHRTRYLVCDALLNPPPSPTPIHCFQYADHDLAIYETAHASFTIFQTPSTFYLVPSADAKRILGPWSDRRAPAGPDKDRHLKHIGALWPKSGTQKPPKPDDRHLKLRPFGCRDVEALYEQIRSHCDREAPTITAHQLHQYTPRPGAPQPGIAIGTVTPMASGQENNPAGPPSRHGELQYRKTNKKTKKGAVDEGIEEMEEALEG